MMAKFKNKYRIESTRLQCWDYGWNASYFITICTAHRRYYFGDVIDKIMFLSDIGCLAWEYWYEMPTQFPFVKLDAFIVMPNHVHMILTIDKPDDGRENAASRKDAIHRAPINEAGEKQTAARGGFAGEKNPMLHDNVPRAIRWYKGVVKFYAKKIDPQYNWQGGFYDRIIRNDRAYENIANYIHDNPRRWKDDRYLGSM